MSEAMDFKVIGTRPIRPDGVDKVTGRASFGADFSLPGMLEGAVLRSPHAHARIKSIKTDAALAAPGVKAVVTGADFPQVAAGAIEGGEGGGFKNPRPVSTMVLLPLIRERTDVPIIAAGGICDGPTMAA
ncbi:MAG: nitronate monooxygenase, partial [Pseudomonadales bacterium]